MTLYSEEGKIRQIYEITVERQHWRLQKYSFSFEVHYIVAMRACARATIRTRIFIAGGYKYVCICIYVAGIVENMRANVHTSKTHEVYYPIQRIYERQKNIYTLIYYICIYTCIYNLDNYF